MLLAWGPDNDNDEYTCYEFCCCFLLIILFIFLFIYKLLMIKRREEHKEKIDKDSKQWNKNVVLCFIKNFLFMW